VRNYARAFCFEGWHSFRWRQKTNMATRFPWLRDFLRWSFSKLPGDFCCNAAKPVIRDGKRLTIFHRQGFREAGGKKEKSFTVAHTLFGRQRERRPHRRDFPSFRQGTAGWRALRDAVSGVMKSRRRIKFECSGSREGNIFDVRRRKTEWCPSARDGHSRTLLAQCTFSSRRNRIHPASLLKSKQCRKLNKRLLKLSSQRMRRYWRSFRHGVPRSVTCKESRPAWREIDERKPSIIPPE